METIARYTESKIKTYGFETKFDLCICEFSLELEQFRPINQGDGDFDADIIPFELAFMGPSDELHCRFSVVVSNRYRNAVKQYISGMNPHLADTAMRLTAPVELLYFFGPHFGDRFGIAEFTFNALGQCNIPLIASVCSGSSVYLVLPEHCAEKAKTAFSKLFEVPQTVQRPGWYTNPSNRIQKG